MTIMWDITFVISSLQPLMPRAAHKSRHRMKMLISITILCLYSTILYILAHLKTEY